MFSMIMQISGEACHLHTLGKNVYHHTINIRLFGQCVSGDYEKLNIYKATKTSVGRFPWHDLSSSTKVTECPWPHLWPNFPPSWDLLITWPIHDIDLPDLLVSSSHSDSVWCPWPQFDLELLNPVSSPWPQINPVSHVILPPLCPWPRSMT